MWQRSPTPSWQLVQVSLVAVDYVPVFVEFYFSRTESLDYGHTEAVWAIDSL